MAKRLIYLRLRSNIQENLVFLYLILFPFGKLLAAIPDVLVFVILILNLRKFKLNNFILICFFSLFFSLSFFQFSQIFTGILYFVRLVSYIFLSYVVYHQFGQSKKKRELISNSLIIVGTIIAIFGWIQYFLFPDLRFLKMFGWDDHYFRLVSTFLDPAFTAILLVLSEILVVIKTLENRNRFNCLLNIFFIFTILFTYSRASYLALFFAIIFLCIKFRKKFLMVLGLFFVILIFTISWLPKIGSEGTNLARTYSINQKFINYDTSIKLIEKSPIFGIGFNNVCVATTKNFNSHSCSGLDNSILFIAATTGIVGVILFVEMILRIIKNTKFDLMGWGLMASFLAIFIHGMFTETFFYNFILGWMAILIGITRRNTKG